MCGSGVVRKSADVDVSIKAVGAKSRPVHKFKQSKVSSALPSHKDGKSKMPSHILGRLGGVPASEVEGPGTFYFGIIDLLQTWTVKKRLERAAKVYLKGKDPRGLSAQIHLQYADRFKERVINDIFDSPESLRRRNANMRSSSARRVMSIRISETSKRRSHSDSDTF